MMDTRLSGCGLVHAEERGGVHVLCLERKEKWVDGEVARWSYLERTVWLIDCI